MGAVMKLPFNLPKLPSLPKFPAKAVDEKPVSATWLIRLADKAVLFACIGAIIAVYILDAIFFAAWAGEDWLVPVFILIALVIRTIAVAAGVALQWVRGRSEIRAARTTIRVIWIAAVLLCLVPAMSFFAGGHKVNTQAADVAVATEAVSTTSKEARIDTLKAQITDIEARVEKDVAEVNKSIEAIMDDDVPGISASDNASLMTLRAEIKGYRDTAQADIDKKREEIRAIETESETVRTEAAETETKVSPFMAIFAVVDEMGGPSADLTSKLVLFAFALLLEAIAAFGLGAYYDIHRVFVRLIREAQETAPIEQPPIEEPKPAPMTPSEKGKKGAQAANLNRKANRMDTRIPLGEPEGAAA